MDSALSNQASRAVAGKASTRAFTLVELLVAMVITVALVLIMAVTLNSVSRVWTQASGSAGMFAAARAGFEAVSRNLSQATLNTYLSYANSAGDPVPLINPSFRPATGTIDRSQVPMQYVRMSELHFITSPTPELFAEAGINGLDTTSHAVFFQAPVGYVNDPENRPKATLLNVLGYYVEFGNDQLFRPDVVTAKTQPKYRYRLMEVIQPAEENGIYASTCEVDANGLAKFTYDLRWLESLDLASPTAPKHPLADNVILMALLPKRSRLDTTNAADLVKNKYIYDSRDWERASSTRDPRMRSQLPPIIELIMVAIDERSAERLAFQYGGAGGTQPPFANGSITSKLDLSSLFQDPAKLDDDIETLETGLADLRVSYRIFRTDVVLPGAKWSSQ